MHKNLATILTDTAKRHGDRTAFKLDEVELNYALLDEASARIAGLLRQRGVAEGDRVGLMLPNVPYFPVLYYGILRGSPRPHRSPPSTTPTASASPGRSAPRSRGSRCASSTRTTSRCPRARSVRS
jgi:acyl-CoA synthetase (AMP-forming)/AMP-acid ligase II